MSESYNQCGQGTAPPCALFMGDFNVGKSAVINALLRRETLPACREESRALPTFIARADMGEARFAAWNRSGDEVDPKTHDEFLNIRKKTGSLDDYAALGALLPGTPFRNLALADTAGMSGDGFESPRLTLAQPQPPVLLVVVTDIEYWSAKHIMDFIAYHQPIFGESLLVAANKADHLNADEIRRLSDRARHRMESYGITPAPVFLPLSARLEMARGMQSNEYRMRMKREVRDRCDAGFDALRVALYEFEARHAVCAAEIDFHTLFASPLAASLTELPQGAAV